MQWSKASEFTEDFPDSIVVQRDCFPIRFRPKLLHRNEFIRNEATFPNASFIKASGFPPTKPFSSVKYCCQTSNAISSFDNISMISDAPLENSMMPVQDHPDGLYPEHTVVA